MPRKAYIADVAKVTAQEIPGINSIAKGSEDGDLNICFLPSSGIPIEIGLLALGMSLCLCIFHHPEICYCSYRGLLLFGKIYTS